jgi:hypothetical protein
MKLAKTDEARPGVKVARDVVDLRGNLLFPAGTELSADLIASCRQRNISHLFVEDEDAPAGDPESRRAALDQDIDRQFAGTGASAPSVALKAAAKRHHLGRPAGA